jgi:hypothetical protein
MMIGTPSLAAALVGYLRRGEEALAAALHEAAPAAGRFAARLAAAQIISVLHELASANQARIIAGSSADALAADALAEAELAFAMLGDGMVAYR